MDSNTQGQESLPLIRTKLRAPSLSSDLVSRPHLIDRLNRGLDRKLTLVSAPAGFGKTTLVASWLEVIDRPVAWLSLDENDNNLWLFLSYLIEAIRTIFPEACQGTLSLLQSSQNPPADYMAGSLINDIEKLPERFILTIDDFHTIHDEVVLRRGQEKITLQLPHNLILEIHVEDEGKKRKEILHSLEFGDQVV